MEEQGTVELRDWKARLAPQQRMVVAGALCPCSAPSQTGLALERRLALMWYPSGRSRVPNMSRMMAAFKYPQDDY